MMAPSMPWLQAQMASPLPGQFSREAHCLKTQRYNEKRPQWRRGPDESYFDPSNLELAPSTTVFLKPMAGHMGWTG